jgi:hypothetical protein
LLALALIAAPRSALAGGLDWDVAGARAVGRAGAATVSEDGGAALLINPGGLVRRRSWRVQLGMRASDRDLTYIASDAPDSPAIGDRASPQSARQIAILGPLGPLVIGVAYLELGAMERSLPSPQDSQPAADVARLFPHRYGGTALGYQRRGLLFGASLRARPWLGVGMSLSISQVELEEQRRVWAGFSGRDTLGDPQRDLALTVSARDDFVPGINLGLLVAPPELPLEMSLSLSFTMDADLRGRAELARTRQDMFPAPEVLEPRSHATKVNPLVARAGVRYLGERVFVEAGGEVAVYRDVPLIWAVEGVRVRDQTQALGALTQVPSMVTERDHVTLRASADVEVASSFLWLCAGYAYRTGASPERSLTPAFADLDGHTLAIGAEGQWKGMTLTIGYARTLSPAADMPDSDVVLVNPFVGGSAPIGQGTYDTAYDLFAASLELAWE